MKKNIIIRTITGIVYVSIVVSALLVHPLFFIILTSVFALTGMIEMQKLLKSGPIPQYWYAIVIIAFAGSLISAYNTSDAGFSIALLVLMLVIIQSGVLFFSKENDLKAFFNLNFSLIYIIIPIYLLNQVHLKTFADGVPYVLITFVLIWVNDTFAYLTGILIGKHKMIERISPAKTWEGFFGGMIFSLIAAYFLHRYYGSMDLKNWLLLGALISLSAVIGDLFESMLKRYAGVKDSGNVFPGHGGMLDRIDSLLMAGPVLFVYLIFIK